MFTEYNDYENPHDKLEKMPLYRKGYEIRMEMQRYFVNLLKGLNCIIITLLTQVCNLCQFTATERLLRMVVI